MITFRRLTLASLSLAIPLAVMAAESATPSAQSAQSSESNQSNSHGQQQQRYPHPLTLEEKVRKGTERFKWIKNARDEYYHPATPCVSGPNEGAMGVHFVKGMGESFTDGIMNPEEPELLIYEPLGNGYTKLVGVEFIAFADDWKTKDPNGDGSPPNVDGHLMNYVGAPNRYGLPAFYELHVWAWEDNPLGTFADWNTEVTCDKYVQPAPAN
jgi:hypothetical protein